VSFLTVTLSVTTLIFLFQKKELVDLATLSDQEIQNDDVVYMVFAKETGVGWEELQADVFTTFGANDGYSVASNT
jgi:hypothetical protein